MKSKIPYLLILFCISVFSQANDEDRFFNHTRNELIDNPTIQPPNVAAFQKVNFIPVSNYTGRADISIPIYTIKSGGITIPISLSYNSSGVKVDDIPSSVGSNWSLNAGGAVSKIVRGIEDVGLNVRHFYQSDHNQLSSHTTGWLFNIFYYKSASMKNVAFGQDRIFKTQSDSRPDLFIANSPGLSTSYIHDDNGAVLELNGNQNIIQENYADILAPSYGRTIPAIGQLGSSYKHIDEQIFYDDRTLFCIDKIQITSINGVEYTYNDLDISQNIQRVYDNVLYTSVNTSDRKIESYKLSKIKDLKTNREINFIYEKYQIKNYNTIDGKRFVRGDWQEETTEPDSPMTVKFPQLNRLKKIIHDQGSVEFVYDLDRLDLPEDKALTEIIVKNKNNDVIKRIKLAYDYIENSNFSSNKLNKRLRLDKVYTESALGKILPGYEFTYNTTALPPRNSIGQDFLGYNNGTYTSTNSLSKPSIFFYQNSGLNSFSPVFRGTPNNELSGDYSLDSNLNYAKAGILEKIIYPTGGFSEFEYELNEFEIDSYTISGGGLRIKNQKIVDEHGNEQILDYEYKKIDGTTSGSILSFPVYNETQLKEDYSDSFLTESNLLDHYAFKIYRVSRSQTELTDNSFVGYSRVVVKNRVNNGYTEYLYTGPADIPNEEPKIITKTYPSAPDLSEEDKAKVNKLINNGALPTFRIDRDLLRGKLLEKNIFDIKGKIKNKTKNHYTYQSIQLKNVESTLPLKSLVGNTSEYYERKIKQNFNLRSERNPITKTITTDYLDGRETSITKEIVYDAIYPQVIENKIDDGIKVLSTKFYYPNDDSVFTQPYLSDLRLQNRLSEVVKQEKFYNGTKIFTESTKYNSFNDGVILPSEIELQKGEDLKNKESRAMYHDYDFNGNPLEISKKDGSHTYHIWGYNKTQLIATLENFKSSDITSDLQSKIDAAILASNADKDIATEKSLQDALKAIQSSVKGSQMTYYTYDPLVGVTSITDPKGYTTYYEYDNFNRLKIVKDADGNLLSKNEYNYLKTN